MKTNYYISAAIISLAIATVATTASAETIIISDSFSRFTLDNQNMTASSPSSVGDVNLPGGTYSSPQNGDLLSTLASTYGNPAPAVSGFQASDAISLASFGAYVKPTLLTISADLQTGSTSGSAGSGREYISVSIVRTPGARFRIIFSRA